MTEVPSNQLPEERAMNGGEATNPVEVEGLPADVDKVAFNHRRPLFVATVFKSGTKLLEFLLTQITGTPVRPIGMDIGSDYERVSPIILDPKEIFIWHNTPTETMRKHLIKHEASAIFLIRNIYDLAVSQYFHFALDVDAEIGHSTKTREYFGKLTQNEGLSLVLCGAQSKAFTWPGFGVQLNQIQQMLKFKLLYPSVPTLILNYDRLVQNKESEIQHIGNFLGITVTPEMSASMLENSSLDAMRQERERAAGSGLHFRRGTPGGHLDTLMPQHYDMINHLVDVHAPLLTLLCEETDMTEIFDRNLWKLSISIGNVDFMPLD